MSIKYPSTAAIVFAFDRKLFHIKIYFALGITESQKEPNQSNRVDVFTIILIAGALFFFLSRSGLTTFFI